jgi:hypothetical protein
VHITDDRWNIHAASRWDDYGRICSLACASPASAAFAAWEARRLRRWAAERQTDRGPFIQITIRPSRQSVVLGDYRLNEPCRVRARASRRKNGSFTQKEDVFAAWGGGYAAAFI